jgi:NitT/TauT family transport system substrate-binding protein
MRKKILSFLAVVAALTILAAGAAAAAGPINVTGSDWPVWETARAMDALGMTPQAKYHFRSYDNSIAMFEAKKADGIFINLYDYLTLCRDKGIASNTALVLVTDYSNGGDVVVVRPDIASPADLKGKNVGLQTNSISLYLLNLTLAQAGLSLGDVNIKNVAGENVGKAFEKGKIFSAVVGWNPYAAYALEKGGKKLADSAMFQGRVVDVLAVWKDSLSANRAAWVDYLRTWFKAVGNPDVLAKMAELNKVDKAEFSSWLEDALVFKAPADSLAAMDTAQQTIQDIEAFLVGNAANVPEDIRSMFQPRPVQGSPIDRSVLEEAAH